MPPSELSIRLKYLVISLATFVALMLFASTFSEPVLRVSFLPDESPTVLRRKFKPLSDYLEQKVGMKIEFRPVSDANALVEALASNKLDMVWFDGFNFIQAKTRSHDHVVPLVQRAEDSKTTSVFITTHNDITKLEDLPGKTLSFGTPGSPSDHLMPRYFLRAARINPDADILPVFSASPAATVLAVTGGKADAGVLNRTAWEKLIAQGKVDPKIVRVFYTTPTYYDYNWAVRTDMDANLRQKLSDAFLALDRRDGREKEILDLQQASQFIPAKAEHYSLIEATAHSAGLSP